MTLAPPLLPQHTLAPMLPAPSAIACGHRMLRLFATTFAAFVIVASPGIVAADALCYEEVETPIEESHESGTGEASAVIGERRHAQDVAQRRRPNGRDLMGRQQAARSPHSSHEFGHRLRDSTLAPLRV